MKKISCSFSSYKALILLFICVILGRSSCSAGDFDEVVVKREERRTLISTEYGQISAARVVDHTIDGSYLLHFFTLDPNSLFLPVILHADMVLYVHTGSGKLRWREEDEVKSADLRRGDIHILEEGSIFLIQSNLDTESERQKLRIHAIFATPDQYIHEIGPYSSIRDMLLGFDEKVLQAAFKVPPEKIQELINGRKPPAIIHGLSEAKNALLEMEARFVEILVGSTTSNNIFEINKKKKKKKDKDKTKLFNLLNADKDFENCNGWSTAVTMKKIPALRGTNIGLFMVNLTEGSVMGPHWNPRATEIAVVVQGRGMIRVVCPGNSNETGCRNMRYEVEEGDTFVVPRFHAMAQMAFNNDTFVLMGFSTSARRNHPQYFAGQASVLRTLDKDVLAVAFNVTNTTMDQLLSSQKDSVILSCISCAEEEFKYVEEEIEKERAKERESEAEEARKREEERQREEEEEAARQEEERERREEEEERKSREEEARKREEEEAKRQEEERKRQEEEEEEARRAEEEERKRQEEEARKREEEAARKQEEEEEARRREDEERKRQEEEEEEAARRREEEEEEAARREDEERKRREQEEEEAAAARRREEEEAAERARHEQEGEGEEEQAQAQEEERRRQEEAQREEEERGPPTKMNKSKIHLFPTRGWRFPHLMTPD